MINFTPQTRFARRLSARPTIRTSLCIFKLSSASRVPPVVTTKKIPRRIIISEHRFDTRTIKNESPSRPPSNATVTLGFVRLTGEATFNFCNRARESRVPGVPGSLSLYARGFDSFDPLLCLTVKPQPLFSLFLFGKPGAPPFYGLCAVVTFSNQRQPADGSRSPVVRFDSGR